MIWILVVIVVVIVIYVHRRLQRPDPRRNQVENAWSQIDVQLKRRIDLIPNLVETVKGYAAHEKDTLDAVVRARNAAIAAPATPAGQAAGRQPAHRRAAPAVRPQRGLPRPQGQPELPRPAGGADRHRGPGRLRPAVLQRLACWTTTTSSQAFPTVIFAKALKFQRREYFETDEAAREVPKVEF